MVKLIEEAESELIKASFRLERLFPRLIKLYLGRRLKKYKEQGTLSDYRLKARRIGKYHYFFEADLYVDSRRGGEN